MRAQLFLVAVVCGACGGDGPLVGEIAPRIDGARFSTTAGLHPAPNVAVQVSDVAAARDLFQLTMDRPPVPPGIYRCPPETGVLYHLAFLSGEQGVAAMTIQPTGCMQIEIVEPRSAEARWRTTDPSYWSALAKDLAVNEGDLYPYPCSNPATASICMQ